jgi:two-component system NarL family response regulator
MVAARQLAIFGWTMPRSTPCRIDLDMSYSVLVIDDYPLLRRGIVSVVKFEPQLELAGETGGCEEGVAAYASLKPDVVLVNLSNARDSNVRAIESLRALDPAARIVSVTCLEPGEDVREALRAGARGCIRADVSIDELVTCIVRVARGGSYLPASVAERLVEMIWVDALSRRELEILKLVSTGKTNKDIGRVAGIAEETVKSHVNRILSKLGAASRTEAVNLAVRRGVIKFA